MSSPLDLAWRLTLCLAATCCAPLLLAQSGQDQLTPARPITDFQQMLERPLFNANRRPEEPASDDPESSADEQRLRENWRLTGVVLEPARRLALFSQLNGNDHLQLEIGTVLEGNWILEQVAADRVVLERGAQRVELLLYDPAALPVAKPAKPPTPESPKAKPKPAADPNAAQPTIPTSSG